MYYFGASIGLSFEKVAGSGSIFRHADAAMYAAKRLGGSQAVLFEPSLHAVTLTHIEIAQDLFRALDRQELEVHYQPLVSVADRRISGFEALVRWRHPDRGWVSPNEFIPRAEEAGLIGRIGAWVLAQAIHQVRLWRETHPDLSIAVNVSARQLTDGTLVRSLPAMLEAERVPATAICLEITESTLMSERSVQQLVALRALGVTVAVDDFGTGHSSLAYLQGLPVDTVKIDRSFVAPLGSSAKADRFFTAIIDLARTLDLKTVAEGCETWGQWRVIEDAGCEKVQGWLVARAMDAAAAEQFLNAPADWSVGRGVSPSPGSAPNRVGPDLVAGHYARPGGNIITSSDDLHGNNIFAAAVAMSRMPMTLVDPRQPDMPVVFVNEAFRRMSGYDDANIIGRNCRFMQGADTDRLAVRRIHDALRAREEISVELVNYRQNGSSFWCAVHISPVFDTEGELVYFFGSQMDLTKRKWV